MVDRRAALVDAGIDLLLQQRFQDLLSSVDTRSITAHAGVTTGSFFHHFKNRAAYTDAVIERLEQLWAESTARSVSVISSFAESIDFRTAAAAEWSRLESERVNSGLQHLLLAVVQQPVSEGSDRTAGDVLAARYRTVHDTVLPEYRRSLAAIGREMMPPLSDVDLAVAITAANHGLKSRFLADPASVRPDLYADVISALVVAVTRPVGEQADVRQLDPLDRQLASGASVVRVRPDGGTWRQIAEAAAPLFVDRRVAEVKVADIAAVAGVSPSTVYHQFGTVSAVAAAAWVMHLDELGAIAAEPLTASEGPIVRMEQVLARYIELARANCGALEGLLLEMVAGTPDRPRPVAEMVPLPMLLQPHIRELRARGVLRRRIDSGGLAQSIVQLISMRVLDDVDGSEERIIDETLGLLLEGALART